MSRRGAWRAALAALALAGCGADEAPPGEPAAPARVVDRARTPLTGPRADSLLALAEEMRSAHPALAAFLDSRDVTLGYELPAAEVVGEVTAREIAMRGMDPDSAVRDLFWIRLIHGARVDGGVEGRVAEIRDELAELVLLGGDNPDALADAELRLEMHQRIAPDEERVVAQRAARVGALLQTPPAAAP